VGLIQSVSAGLPRQLMPSSPVSALPFSFPVSPLASQPGLLIAEVVAFLSAVLWLVDDTSCAGSRPLVMKRRAGSAGAATVVAIISLAVTCWSGFSVLKDGLLDSKILLVEAWCFWKKKLVELVCQQAHQRNFHLQNILSPKTVGTNWEPNRLMKAYMVPWFNLSLIPELRYWVIISSSKHTWSTR
jgi:hypothetical protein